MYVFGVDYFKGILVFVTQQSNRVKKSFPLDTIDPQLPPSSTHKIKGWVFFRKSRLDNTFGRKKHTYARAWQEQPINRIGPIWPPIRPSKGRSGVLQIIAHSVTGSMTAQPTGFHSNAWRVATHSQQVTRLGRGFTPLLRCSWCIL